MRILATSRPTPEATPEALQEDMDAEIAQGAKLYEDGLIREAYMDPDYERTFMLLDAPSVDAAREAFSAYPQVASGLIAFEFTELIGMPAVAAVHEQRGEAPPAWWPG